MASYKHRPYADGDLPGMERILFDGRRASPRSGYMHVGDLEWSAFGPHGYPLPEIIEVWEDGDGIAGWAIASAASVACQVRPGLRGSDFEREICDVSSRGVMHWRRQNGMAEFCAVEVFADDAARIQALESLGFVGTENGGVQFMQPLDREIRSPQVPDGYEVRGLRDGDVDSRATAQFEAFSPGSKTTPATWRHLMANAPGYDPDLDNVVVAADGTVVAGALMWLDVENRVGLFEPVGTRPSYQRLGLGAAALTRGLRTLRSRGMMMAMVSTNATNASAIALYTSAGFVETNRMVEYELRAS